MRLIGEDLGGIGLRVIGGAGGPGLPVPVIATPLADITGSVGAGPFVVSYAGAYTDYTSVSLFLINGGVDVTIDTVAETVTIADDVADGSFILQITNAFGSVYDTVDVIVTPANTAPVSQAIALATTVPAGTYDPSPAYSQNFIDTNGTARLSTNTAPGNNAKFTLSAWIRPFNTTSLGTVLSAMNGSGQGVRIFLFSDGGNLEVRWIVHDSAGTAVWIGMSQTGGLAANTTYHVYLAVDLAGAGSFDFLIDGAAPTISNIAGPAVGSGIVLLSQAVDIGWKDVGAVDNWDGRVSDLFFQAGAILPVTDFISGGAPKSLIGVGAPFVFLGDTMTADERGGNAGEGWNDGFNLGSAAMSVLSGTFTDA